ncbi:MAG: winged helix-turn-helix transcriptional regulator [Chloroflexi bacterium]|nr:winged helix-turn-helix transcriptional regulator [Chloroflexota bacterium]
MATSKATRTPSRPTTAPGGARVRDFTGGAARFDIEWDVRPAYDFLFSLSPDAGATEDLPAADRRWLQEARASLAEIQKTKLGRMVKEDLGIHLGGFIVEHPDLHTAADVAAAMRAAGATDVLRWLFSELCGAEPAMSPIVERALEGDRPSIDALRGRVSDSKHGMRLDFLDDPEREFEDVVSLLAIWAARFAEIEPRVETILRRDYELRASDRRSLTGSDLVERTTNGVRVIPEAGVKRVILAPSYFSRPYNFLLGGEGWRFAGYPVADAAIERDPLSPPANVLRLHRALGDATRLRILKLLAEKDLYATEMSEILELSKPTITHHLAQLRVAGLVTAIEAGAVIYYHLRRERLDEASGDLRAFLA